jgi:hypothetical protein
MRDSSSNKLIESLLPHLSFLPPWEATWAGESGCPQEKLARDPTLYTLTSSGTCTKKRQGATCSDTTDPDYFENEMKVRYNNEIHINIARNTEIQ